MATSGQPLTRPNPVRPRDATAGVFFWLSAFYFVYCARPEEWIPGLGFFPLAKISAFFAIVGLITSLGRTKRGFKDLPSESKYLLALLLLLLFTAPLSPVWKGGAVMKSLEFSKVYFVWVLTFLMVTTVARLRRLIFIQAGSVALVSVISVLKGSGHLRLQGVLGGIYSNPNDLAFSIVITLPLVLLLLLTSRNALSRVGWFAAMLMMMYTLFLTASRAGFIDFVISAPVALWFFAVKGRRPQLIVATVLVGVSLLAFSGKLLRARLFATSGSNLQTGLEQSAYGSFEERKLLMGRAVTAMVQHPLTGLGAGDFVTYSGIWKEVHVTYLQIGAEGGIPVLILYLMFFYSGFRNLKKLNKKPDLDPQARLFVGALYSCLFGFVVGACFAPEAYQFFPFFTIAYVSALVAIVREQEAVPAEAPARGIARFRGVYGNYGKPDAVTVVR